MPEPPMMPSTDLVMVAATRAAHVFSQPWGREKHWRAPVNPLFDTKWRVEAIPPLTSSRRNSRLNRRRLGLLPVRRLARFLDLVPNPLLGEIQEAGQDDEENNHLEADPPARLQRGLRRPHQEGRYVLGVLVDRLRRAVRVRDDAIRQGRWHSD